MIYSRLIPTKLSVLLAIAILATLFTATSRAAVLWSETFTVSTAGNYDTYNSHSWVVYDKLLQQNVSSTINPWTGTATNTVAIAGRTDLHGTIGIAAYFSADTASGTIVNAFKSGLSVANPGTLTYDAMKGATTVTGSLQLMVQVGSQWYVSATSVTPSGSGGSSEFSTKATTYTFDFTTNSTWYNYTPAVTGTYALGSSLTLDVSQQTITGIGWYETLGTSSALYVDNMVINSIPEPTTAMLLGMGAFSMLWQMNRRRRS